MHRLIISVIANDSSDETEKQIIKALIHGIKNSNVAIISELIFVSC